MTQLKDTLWEKVARNKSFKPGEILQDKEGRKYKFRGTDAFTFYLALIDIETGDLIISNDDYFKIDTDGSNS